jgi:hypothetical protein
MCEPDFLPKKLDVQFNRIARQRAECGLARWPKSPTAAVAWENILDVSYNYVKGHNPKDDFGIYDVVRFDTFWLDKA